MAVDLLERGEALVALDAALRAVAEQGEGRIALVSGEAGIGKTSVLRAFAASHATTALWWGGCEALQTPHPLAPLYDIARESAGVRFARLLSSDSRAALFDAVLDELRLAAAPTLVVIDDAHWADDATLDLIRFLGRRIERTRALLAVSWRDDEVGATHALRRALGELPSPALTRIELKPLSAEAVAALAERAGRAATGLHAATRGNPFFVTEVLRQAGDDGALPPSVQALVLARYARLGASAQRVLRLASIVPVRIERWLVEALCAPALADLDACLDSGLLVADAEALAFRHELARRAVEQSIAAPHAQRLHAQVLAAWQQRGGAALARLVHHAARSGDAAAVLRSAPDAAREAAAKGAHREAAAHCATALAHAQGLDATRLVTLYEARAYECYLVGDIEQAVAAREAALPLWRRLRQPLKEGDTLRWLSRLHWFLGHKAQADAHAAAAVQVLEAQPPGAELAMAYSNQAQLHALAEDTAPAVQWGERAIALAERLGNDEILAHALNNVGVARYVGGETAGAQQLDRSLALALRHGLEEHAARAYCNLASGAVKARHYARAADAFERGVAYCVDHDLDAWTLYLLAWRAQAHLEQGRWNAAAADAEAVLARRDVPAISRIPALAALGRLRVRRGDPGADTLLDEALALAQPTGELQRLWPVASARAEAAWLAGDAARCALEARRGLEPALERRSRWAVGEMTSWLRRAGALDAPALAALLEHCAEPFALQLGGRWREAAAAWAALGCPYEQARALGDGDDDAQRRALGLFDALGARPAADALRQAMRARGERRVPRGPRASTRANAFGLTRREVDILGLLGQGLTNAQIGSRRHVSIRTVDHHVAAILAKMQVSSREAAVRAARAHGVLAQDRQDDRAR